MENQSSKGIFRQSRRGFLFVLEEGRGWGGGVFSRSVQTTQRAVVVDVTLSVPSEPTTTDGRTGGVSG